jgi:hypothetical protein
LCPCKKILFFLLTLLVCCTQLFAQVSVNLRQPPMNQLKIADLWNLTVVNTSNNNYRIYLQGSASESRDGLIAEAKTPSFDLKAHETKSFTANNIGSADISWKNNKYKEIIIRTGGAPTGNYTICAYAKMETTDEELGRDCREQTVEIISPVVLISPDNEASVDEKNPTFTWLPPPGARSVTYSLKIAEIFGPQSPEEAISKNTPFFEIKDIRAPMLIYPVSGKNFETGKRYAWQVEAFAGSSPVSQSETWVITIGSTLSPGNMITRQEAIDIIVNEVIVPPTLSHNVSAYLGMETIKEGSVIWPFKNDEPVITVSAPTWFGWVNDAPLAFFEHPTRYVLINAHTGSYEVLTKKWWPVLNGESLWMSEEEKENPAVLIYSDVH